MLSDEHHCDIAIGIGLSEHGRGCLDQYIILGESCAFGSDIDIDLHVLTATDGTGCLARDDSEVELTLPPGVYWLSLDTHVGSREFPGPYLLSATFSGELGEVPGEDDSGLALDSETTDPGASPSVDQPGSVVSIQELGGCSHAPGRGGLKLALIILIGTLISRSSLRLWKAPNTVD